MTGTAGELEERRKERTIEKAAATERRAEETRGSGGGDGSDGDKTGNVTPACNNLPRDANEPRP